jgi:hypothetical protein
MKVEVTKASVVNEHDEVVATVELVALRRAVRVQIYQEVGWNEWIAVYEAVKRIMLLMEVKND